MTTDHASAPAVVSIDHRFADLDIERDVLKSIGARVIDAASLSTDAALAVCADADAILSGSRIRFDAARIATLRRCRALVRYGIGVENIDVAAARRHGIEVANVPDYCVEEVATHALAMILAMHRGLLALDRTVHAGNWRIPPTLSVRRLSECTLGVVGFGRIGQALAVRAAALGMSVLATDPVRPSGVREGAVDLVSLDELLQKSEFVSIHASRAFDARPLLDRAAIARMKNGAFLVNVARGGLVDQTALIDALRDGRLAGAGLDVTDPEPPPEDAPILSAPNVLMTPHSAWYSVSAIRELRYNAANEVARVLAGNRPLHPVTV